ncbi:hypothetical protein Taro_054358 [Colocasia esculenta]|uniref:Transmembrane protein 45B n=1 Tax=Colocasia esculenta TaxID=4460 RepID=A0A843XNL7_COLES|nr:hypothetical protein [Colocasia esculenta]
MGSLVGHVLPGFGFLLIGLWQLFNHIKLHCQHPKTYKPPIWFPVPRVRHLELYLIMFGGLASISMELFIGPSRHQPLDPADWTIPTNHLHNFEHSTISLSIVTYAVFALCFDRVRTNAGHTVSLLIGAASFSMEFLLFYLHSTDHTGIEWQYHWLLQKIIAVSLLTTLMGIGYPRSFAVGFTRSASVLLQGIWFNVVGIMLYTPRFIPKGCHLESDDGFLIVPCDDHASLHRGKALVNLQFAWSLTAVVVFSGWLYLRMAEKYPEVPEYESLKGEEQSQEGDDDFLLESPKKIKSEDDKSGALFLSVGRSFSPMGLER